MNFSSYRTLSRYAVAVLATVVSLISSFALTTRLFPESGWVGLFFLTALYALIIFGALHLAAQLVRAIANELMLFFKQDGSVDDSDAAEKKAKWQMLAGLFATWCMNMGLLYLWDSAPAGPIHHLLKIGMAAFLIPITATLYAWWYMMADAFANTLNVSTWVVVCGLALIASSLYFGPTVRGGLTSATVLQRECVEHSARRYRTGATCRDGSYSAATGRGACSWHGGVRRWQYGTTYTKTDAECLEEARRLSWLD